MVKTGGGLGRLAGMALVALAMAGGPVRALDSVTFSVPEAEAGLRADLRAASLLATSEKAELATGRDVLAAALADYTRLIEALYAKGYYGPVIHIRLDGREASDIQLLSIPATVSKAEIAVNPGRPFRFSRAVAAPLAPGTELPEGFRAGARARSVVVQQTADAAIAAWRDAGHAKAAIGQQRFVADHAAATLAADLRIAAGPQVRFGAFTLNGDSAVRDARVRQIAGFPEGQVYSPADLRLVAKRLRRTGAFRSVSFEEADRLGPSNTMDIDVMLVDEKPRRFGVGAELSSLEGLTVSGFWMHRNLRGGAERLRFDAEVANIGGETGGVDYSLGVRLDRPAALGTDTNVYAFAGIERLDEPDYLSDQITLGVGATKYVSDTVELGLGVALYYADVEDSMGARNFSLLTFPAVAEWDERDDVLNPTDGFYVNAELTPFWGFNGSSSGGRLYVDARGYHAFGAQDGLVLAGRAQFGAIAGAGLTEVPPDYLFYSGGGGTVRGQPYQSLNIDLGGGNSSGGRSFVGLSAELRGRLTDTIGLVGFVDAGYIGEESFYDGSGAWHSGGGVGLRYQTGIGPIRLDLAAPLSGDTGSGLQVYIGIGQAF